MRIGIYNRYWSTRGGAERYAGIMAEILSRDHEVELLACDEIDLDDLEKHLGLDLSATRLSVVPPLVERDLSPLTASYDLFINCTFLSGLASEARRSVYVVLFPQKVLPPGVVCAVRRVVDWAGSQRRLPFSSFAKRLGGWMDRHDRGIPASYDLLLAISEFTRTWVSKRWRHPSEVLAPPVDTATFVAPPASQKRKVILSVGRFFQGAHNKKHVEMLEVFRGMVDRGEIADGWEYHLVGNLHRNRRVHLDYFSEVEKLAEGYPVKLLVDLPFDRLVEEYRRASIFWHAAGWGESESRRPDKLEHFGITTCEAMSSGCIPVVIARAGQLEIVEHGETGFLFTDAHELAAITRRLVDGHGETWTRELLQRASESVQRFGRAEFEERLCELFESHGLLTA